MDGAGGKEEEEEEEGSVSSMEGVSQTSTALPIAQLPPASQQLPSCLISSPRSTSSWSQRAGADKSLPIDSPSEEGAFLLPLRFSIQAPLPPLGPGPRAH